MDHVQVVTIHHCAFGMHIAQLDHVRRLTHNKTFGGTFSEDATWPDKVSNEQSGNEKEPCAKQALPSNMK